jgi:hypothetical protein
MQPSMRAIASAVALLIAAFSAIGLAAADDPPAQAPATDSLTASPAMEQLMRMAGFLSQLGQFSVRLQSGYDAVQESGQKIEFGERRELVLVRPDRFRIDVERTDGEATRVVFDGQSISLFNANLNLYASSELQGDIDAAIKHFVKDLKMRLPLSMLWVTTLTEELEERVREAAIVETATLDGQPFVHVAARADSVDFQVWIPERGDPLPRRIVITYKDEAGQPQYWANFSDWNLSPNPLVSRITHDIPKDARRIPFHAEIRTSAMPSAPTGPRGGRICVESARTITPIAETTVRITETRSAMTVRTTGTMCATIGRTITTTAMIAGTIGAPVQRSSPVRPS